MGCSFWRQRKGITIGYAFQKLLDKFERKSYKLWVDGGGPFYNRSMK